MTRMSLCRRPHEMSTHYGRMVTTDTALMLFSDPTDAMQYLMSGSGG